MKAVASMVTAGYTLCDVGTDHGYVPIALVQGNIIQKAIAVDINKGPLERANEHIRANGLTEKITTRLSNGLEAIHDGEVDSIVIAGMGGELVIHILTAGETVCRSAKELILQPQSEVSKVREYVRNTGYKIVDEDMILEDGKYYPMFQTVCRVRTIPHGTIWTRRRLLYAICTDRYLSKTVIRCFGSFLSGNTTSWLPSCSS